VTYRRDVGKDVERVQLLAAGEISNYKTEKRFLTRSGDVICGLLTVSVVREADGTPMYSCASSKISQHGNGAKEELEAISLRSPRYSWNHRPIGILVIDRNRRM